MKKSKLLKTALCVLLALLLCLSLAGCKPGSRFVGKWRATTPGIPEYQQVILEFRRDGTATLNGKEVYYTVNSDDKTIRLSSNIFTYEECSYEFDGSKKLTISGAGTYHDVNGSYEKIKK